MSHEVVLVYFAKYIETQLGIIYSPENYFQLQNRLEEIAKLLGLESIEKLHSLALNGQSESFRQILLDIATNNETSFFRDSKIFEAIKNRMAPTWPEANPVRIWSAASSSGQEALSIAMTLLEWSRASGKKLDFKITGTDISDRILNRARSAQYTQLEVQRGLPSALLVRYFEKEAAATWRANSELRSHIEYSRLNLTENFNFTPPFDLILCRNVLIYQNVQRKAEILKRIQSALKPDGYLILGAAESLIGLTNSFESVSLDGAVIYRKTSHDRKVEQEQAA